MRESKDATPPLTYSPVASDRGRESTADCTPVSTPISATANIFGPPRPRNKDRDLYFSWAKKPAEAESALLESDVLFEDTGDCCFPLFPSSPPKQSLYDMDNAAAPIDITSPSRFNSQSPRTSNLTAALQEADASGEQPGALNIAQRNGSDGRLSVTRLDSSGNGLPSSYYGSGARQIPGVKDRPRRESSASSFANGMSWGGVSVGSWVRDDILMTGTSPYAFHQSPSFHSSSYLPKMEANFLKDYSCCGITLDSLHELLQHYEENHAQSSSQMLQRPAMAANGAGASALPATTGADVMGASVAPPQAANPPTSTQVQQQQQLQSTPRQQATLPLVQDVDSLDDMEMDDDNGAPPTPMAANFGFSALQPQQNFQQTTQVPTLNMNLANTLQTHQGMRASNPSTPVSVVQPGFNFNTSISSVNTPTFATPTSGTQQSPDSSIPGTPQAIDFGEMPLGTDFSAMNLNMPMDTASLNAIMQNPNWASMNFGLDNTIQPMNTTIDEPAKRLFSKTGGQLTQQQLQYAMRTGQFGDDENMQKLIAQQMQGRTTTGGILGEPENKPFKCPVIGCEKAYKNQNGLKYHKQHGHQNQQLKSNPDGTFSIVDPVTSIPYPGTLGMEKEKPYRCEVCGKRYKNLKGLKYHRQHSPPCNPELKVNLPNLAGVTAQSVNVAGAGLMGGEVGGMY